MATESAFITCLDVRCGAVYDSSVTPFYRDFAPGMLRRCIPLAKFVETLKRYRLSGLILPGYLSFSHFGFLTLYQNCGAGYGERPGRRLGYNRRESGAREKRLVWHVLRFPFVVCTLATAASEADGREPFYG